jgi:Toprim-like
MTRFTRKNPCPVCRGWDSQKRKIGKRCYGFLSSDRKYAHCTREKYAGCIPITEKTQTYPHILHGRCDCGTRHKHGNAESEIRKVVATYSYRDSDGNLLFQVLRGDPKSFWLRRPDGDGWQWNLDGVTLTLYRLPQLLAATRKRTVFVVEGEKDARSLAKLGLVATTSPGGAGKWKPEFSELLRDRKVAILPDNDEAGRSHALQVAESIVNHSESVRIVRLPDLPSHGDVSDWLANGGGKAALLSLTKQTPKFVATRDSEINFRTPREMGASDEHSVDWIVPPFVAAGCITAVIGKVKAAGKTTFVTNMASALVRGKKFLGERTKKCPAICMSEQPRASYLEALKRARLTRRKDFLLSALG